MPSIETLGTPLVFKVKGARPAAVGVSPDRVCLRTELRALEGMQKEALVRDRASGGAWRMVCDEGPYLNGTDLAPFPLAFYTAGVVFSLMTEIQRHAEARNLALDSLAVSSDHFYTMQGSALRGDMIGGAKPVEVEVDMGTAAGDAAVAEILAAAQASSPAEAYMRESLRNTFTLTANGSPLELSEPAPSNRQMEDPAADFDQLDVAEGEYLDDIITKMTAAEVVEGVEGGAGSSLKAEQKRMLHVRGEARMLRGTLQEIRVHLFKPIGSSFRFFSDSSNTQAPSALAYLSAGVGFCFMTQIGRYAHIARKQLTAYRIVQDNVFHIGDSDAPAAAEPVDTHAFLSLNEPDDVARKIVYMSERTCFLHAAMRGAHPSRIRSA